MAQANFTPIQLYYSTTALAVPTSGNLLSGELALNIVDEKLYFKNSSGVVKLLASVVAPGATGNVLTSDGTNWTSQAPAVGPANTVTLTNKTISVDNNTITGYAASSFVLADAGGTIDGTAAQKVIPVGVVVGTTDTQTLTNKRINSRVSSATSTASITPDVASFDQYCLTAQAATLTINAPTGTPVDGTKLLFRILDNGTARTLTWNATYTVIGVSLPTATVAGKMLYVGCVYNAANTRWDVIATAAQA